MTRKPVRGLSRNEIMKLEDDMRLSRQLKLERMSVDADDAVAIMQTATAYYEHHRKRGRSKFDIPTEMMAGLLTAAALNRNNADSAKALRRDAAVREKKQTAKHEQRPDEFRRKSLNDTHDQLPLVEDPDE